MKRVINYHADWHPLDTDVPFCKCGCGQRAKMDNFHNKWKLYAKGHYRQPGKYKDSSWLRIAYLDENRTKDSIANECNVSVTTICKFLKRFAIPFKEHPSYPGSRSGPNNPAWKGGTTPERQRLYKQGHWREFSLAIYARDDYLCRHCGERPIGKQKIQCHHLRPWATNPSLRFESDNCVTLCRPCHKWVHGKANTEHQFLG